MNNRFPEVNGFGSADPDWPAIPERHTVPEVAAHYLRHRVTALLRRRNVTALDLSKHLGETEGAWRSRLNGNRGLSIDDLVGLLMLFPELAAEIIPGSSSVDDWLPVSYAGLAVGNIDGSGVPLFRKTEIDWKAVSSEVEGWWSAAVADGTAQWAIDANVLTHQLVQAVDVRGLPRRLAALGGRALYPVIDDFNTASVRVDWTNRDTSITVVWLDPFAVPEATEVRRFVANFAETLWTDRSEALVSDISVLAAPKSVTASFRDLLETTSLGKDPTAILSMKEARRLGVSDPAARTDLQVTTLDDGAGPLLWLLIKG